MKKNFKTILLIFLVLVGGYLIWSSTNKGTGQQPIFKIDVVESYGDSTGKGNVLGVQAFMTPIDYASEANFRQKIEFYLIEAKKNKWLISKKTIVVFPEYIGTFLLLSTKKKIYIKLKP
jgi:hypothetical protein